MRAGMIHTQNECKGVRKWPGGVEEEVKLAASQDSSEAGHFPA